MTGTNSPRVSCASRLSRASARELIEAVVDPGSWYGWDEPVEITTEDPDYRADLERARERTGLDESVITGEGRIEGRRVALVACEFRFLAGSIGVAAGERLVRAVERATAERLPLLATPASGGTRMQEGTVAFLQMVKVAAAITDHKAAGLPYLVHLRHPTTGGVLASWGSLGHVTAAEPGALIGFMGPRVHEALYGEEFPPGVQNAENLMHHGLIDAVLPLSRLSGVAARVLRVLCAGDAATGPAPTAGAALAPDQPRDAGGASTGPAPGTPGDAPSGTPGRHGGIAAGGGPSVARGADSGEAEAFGGGAGRWDPEAGSSSAVHGHVVPGGRGAERDASGADAVEAGSAAPTPAPPSGALPRAGAGGRRGDVAAGGAGGVGAVHDQAGVTAFAGAGGGGGAPDDAEVGAAVPSAEESIRASRRAERPGLRDLLRVAAEDVSPLSGTGAGEHDPGLLLALARVGGTPCVVLGHNRRSARKGDTADGPGEGQALGPAGLRTARRGMRIAAELGLPLLTVIDTAGAALSREAEEGGLAGEIARCLADMVTLPAPTLCLLLGQGAGGAALALLPADRVVAARHAWLSPLPPEGASAILHRTTERAYEVAARQGVRSADLLAQGIVDRIVEEDGEADGETDRDTARTPDASRTADAFLGRLGRLLGDELAALRAQDPDERLAARRVRQRGIGLPR
ncbi:carboxyl transferase domain-containing protein [Streptomyces luomodiensis]|uniref:Acetyl-coenzyme A carboxylase carboxyl transferase subunits beta/alpha n=1 Tax=Streptomyces luomodiensis TaxID=3026192 RepID=A0ABY9UV28_9ACTN|nr:carboxyl transferase domain-containing protein [Streptomyces sp. SCA4-21]WNE95715.1 carboxyl transferase domain-containing protein [Streptomyces sp. SCA4-21]